MRGKGIKRIILMVLCVVLLFGCQQFRNSKKKEINSIRIGITLYRGDDTFINNLRMEMEDQAKAFEQETGIKVNLDIVEAKESQNTQNEQVDRFLSVGCEVLCVNMVDRFAASAIIDKAMAANVPVIFFNRQPVEEDLNRWEQLYYIGVDAKETAIIQGNLIVDVYKQNPALIDLNGDGKVKYVLLEGESSHQDSLIRTEWTIKTLKNGGVPIEKVTGGIANWERSQASALMEQWLNLYPDEIELVISNNDDMALGAIDALERMGVLLPSANPEKAGLTTHTINLVGIDATIPGKEAVEQGKLLGTVDSDKETYARVMFHLAVEKAMRQDGEASALLEDGTYFWCPQKVIIRE